MAAVMNWSPTPDEPAQHVSDNGEYDAAAFERAVAKIREVAEADPEPLQRALLDLASDDRPVRGYEGKQQ